MSEFKVGSKVKVREWDDLAKQYGLSIGGHIRNTGPTFVEAMRRYCGEILEVRRVYSDYVNLDGAGSWSFAFDTIRLVDEGKKFKVGDKVKCIGTDVCAEDAEIGDVGKIIHIENGAGLPYCVEFENVRSCYHDGNGNGEIGHCYFCSEKMLEFVEEESLFENNSGKKIVIHIDGKKTIAELYEGEKVVKTKTAKCNDGDEFNFETGAKIAFDRLLERVADDTPHLTCNEIYNSPSYGVIGTPTKYKDVLGRALFVGDTVDLFTENGDCIDEVAVVETEAEGQFVMGIACDCDPKKGTTGHWRILKKRSYKDVECGETVGMIDYVDKVAK